MRQKILVRGLAGLTMAGGAFLLGSCNLVLGLNKYVDCPGDPSCPAESTATCTDGMKDGEETGVDCGGPSCPACADGQDCKVASDCKSTICVKGTCLATTCDDKVQDGNETGVDCGGSCSPCTDGDGCVTGADCIDKVCTGGTCAAPTCTDGVKNGTETDVDCGGSCPSCGVDKDCAKNADCESMVCTGGECQPTCMDDQKDGQETGVDCGGPTCMPCPDMGGCLVDRDCQSGICQGTTCAAIDELSTSFADTGTSNLVENLAVTVDSSNNVLLAGSFAGTLNFGTQPLTSSGENGNPPTSGFVAKFNASGVPAWSMTISDVNAEDQLLFITTDPADDVYVNGYFFMDGPLVGCNPGSMAMVSTFVGKLDSFGDTLWCNAYGTDIGPVGGPMVVDGAGNLVLALISLGGTADFGGGPLTTPSLTTNTDLIKLDSTGKYIWAQQLGGANSVRATTVVVDSKNDIILSGWFSGSVSFGGTMLTSQAGTSLFVVKLDPNGQYLWGAPLGDNQGQDVTYAAVDAMDNIFLAGEFSGTINLGGGSLTSAGSTDIFAAKLDSTGKPLWSKSFGDAAAQSISGLSLDPKGQPVITGTFAGTVNFGGSTFTSSGGPVMGSDIYIAKFDTNGNHLWSRSFGTSAGQMESGIAVDKTGAAWLTGTFNGTLDFGPPPQPLVNPGMGGADIFLAKLLTP